ncbi:MAG: NUDIX domain-containing protein [Candidatus Woesearchaeota archaeon]|jgi:8-oxo-dGTP diphosphatase
MNENSKKQFIIVKSLVIDSKGRLLFVKRKREWHAESHNKWEFPGGKVEFGENPENTAVRETKEESGYDVAVTKLIPKILTSEWEYSDHTSQQILICYICKLIKGTALTTDHNVSEVKWFELNDIPAKKDCLPGTTEFIKEYKKIKNNH